MYQNEDFSRAINKNLSFKFRFQYIRYKETNKQQKMNCSIKLSLALCLLIGVIAMLPEKSLAEIDPSSGDDSSDSSYSSYSSSSSNELDDEENNGDEQRYNSDWQRLIKSMCLNLISSNDKWFASANSSLRRKCLAYLIGGRGSSSSQSSESSRQRRFFQIHVGKTNQLKSESDAKAGFKYGRK